MTNAEHTVRPLDAKRREQTPQALARLALGALFTVLWLLLWLLSIPMPIPFLLNLFAYMLFFLLYWRLVFLLPTFRAVELAHYGMLGAEIIFYTTMVYFLGGISWLGAFAYVFGLIFANTFLDLRRGLVYTGGVSLAFTTLILLEATGVVPHYAYLEEGLLRYSDPRFVTTTVIGGFAVFLSIYLWMNWVGYQLRRERDGAVRAQEEVLGARAELERANAELEERVSTRTAQFEQANAALRESETVFRTLAETVTVAVFILQGDKMLYVNPAAETLSGYTRDELLEMNFWDAVHPEVQETMRSRAMAKQRGESAPGERVVKIVTKTGQERWAEFRVSTIMFEGRAAILGAAFDITEGKRAEEALREQALRDPLTGLLNRRAGLTDDQSVVCRMGGDEFEIGLEGVGLYQAVLRAEELRASLQRSLEASSKEGGPKFKISIGVACYPQEGENVVELWRSADRAMYAAKAAGGDTTRAWRHLAPRQAA